MNLENYVVTINAVSEDIAFVNSNSSFFPTGYKPVNPVRAAHYMGTTIHYPKSLLSY